MDDLSAITIESTVPYGKKTSVSLYDLEQPFFSKLSSNGGGYSNPSLSLHTSMVWGFARHLPYSMDIEQEEYVPGDFLNIEPFDVNENKWFKWNDRRTFFNAMVSWGDTFRSGVLLQVCYIFQQMLLGNISADHSYSEQDYKRLRIDEFTRNEKYNRKFFGVLLKLPSYYEYVVSSSNTSERRERLKEVYGQICQAIEMRVGSFRQTDADGKIVREVEGTIGWDAWRDVELRVYFDNTRFFDGLELDLTKQIKERQLSLYNKRKRIK